MSRSLQTGGDLLFEAESDPFIPQGRPFEAQGRPFEAQGEQDGAMAVHLSSPGTPIFRPNGQDTVRYKVQLVTRKQKIL